jgi:hypothetical protein
MVRVDSYEPGEATDECTDCLHRVQSDGFPGACPDYDGKLWNIAVPRE